MDIIKIISPGNCLIFGYFIKAITNNKLARKLKGANPTAKNALTGLKFSSLTF